MEILLIREGVQHSACEIILLVLVYLHFPVFSRVYYTYHLKIH